VCRGEALQYRENTCESYFDYAGKMAQGFLRDYISSSVFERGAG
jgi:hypothetical protein